MNFTLTHLLVGPEYGAFPVWNRSPDSLWGGVGRDYLPISTQLGDALEAWNSEWEDFEAGTDVTVETWEAQGRRLVADLERELGPSVTISYYGDGADMPAFDKAAFLKAHRVAGKQPNGHSIGDYLLG